MASVRCPDCDASIREEALGEHRRKVHGRTHSPRRPLLLLAVLLAVAVVAAGLLLRPGPPALTSPAAPATLSSPTPSPQVQEFPNLGQVHLQPGDPPPVYNSRPPTSGPHNPAWAPWGVHTQPLPDEIQIHNLEHGGIMVQYRPDLDPATVERLRAQVQRHRSKVILAPYPGLASDVALTAWTRLDAFNGYDEARITRFIETYRDKGPEKVPD